MWYSPHKIGDDFHKKTRFRSNSDEGWLGYLYIFMGKSIQGTLE